MIKTAFDTVIDDTSNGFTCTNPTTTNRRHGHRWNPAQRDWARLRAAARCLRRAFAVNGSQPVPGATLVGPNGAAWRMGADRSLVPDVACDDIGADRWDEGDSSTWSTALRTAVAAAEEIEVSAQRSDGSWSTPRVIWIVGVGDGLYVRSVNGPDANWFRHTQERHRGRVVAAGVATQVRFAAPAPGVEEAVDLAYRVKYGRYAARTLDRITSDRARSTTRQLLLLDPSQS